MTTEIHIAHLRGLLGAKGVLVGKGELASYQTGARGNGGAALFVARPTTTEEASKVVSYCSRNGIHIIPQSGNTGLVSGSTLDLTGTQAVLSLDRLNKRFDLDRDNRSLHVDAGFRLSEINRRLESEGLFFPIDLGSDPCIGGMVSTNTGGSRFLRYGDVRRNTLGLRVVLADTDGTIIDLAGGLRKNNTGVDWKQVFIGTSGVFGVITECVINLERSPRQTATAYLVPTSGAQVMTLLSAVEDTFGNDLSTFEGISGNAFRRTLEHLPAMRNPFESGRIPNYVILLEVSWPSLRLDKEARVEALLEAALEAIWEHPDHPLADAFVGRPEEMWALRHALPEGVRSAGTLISFDLSFRRGVVMRFLGFMREELSRRFPGVEICDFGHVGDGGVHFNLVIPREDRRLADNAFVEALREWIIDTTMRDFGGSFSAEHGIGRKNQAVYDRFTPQKLKAKALALKMQTSPSGLGAVRFN
jgi:FAD/FMN-containing dehydrogenase